MTTALLALVIISMHPWYDDNGAPEFISWPYRWAWAAELAGWLAILVLSAAFGLRALARRMAAAKRGSASTLGWKHHD